MEDVEERVDVALHKVVAAAMVIVVAATTTTAMATTTMKDIEEATVATTTNTSQTTNLTLSVRCASGEDTLQSSDGTSSMKLLFLMRSMQVQQYLVHMA
jgi:hypothetical protein